MGGYVIVCYAVAAGVLETKINEYDNTIDRLKRMSTDSISNIEEIQQYTDNTHEWILEEKQIIREWKEKVDINSKCDSYKMWFTPL